MNCGDLLRKFFGWLDAGYIHAFGRMAYHHQLVKQETNSAVYHEDVNKTWTGSHKIRALYELPYMNDTSAFGIDAPDEMIFEVSYKDLATNLPNVGDMLSDDKCNRWIVINRHLSDSLWFGDSRLRLSAQLYHETAKNIS